MLLFREYNCLGYNKIDKWTYKVYKCIYKSDYLINPPNVIQTKPDIPMPKEYDNISENFRFYLDK